MKTKQEKQKPEQSWEDGRTRGAEQWRGPEKDPKWNSEMNDAWMMVRARSGRLRVGYGCDVSLPYKLGP